MVTNNITDKNTLKSWFKRGLKPLEAQFHAWMDSYWHKDEKIPTGSVNGLEATLNNKAETSTVEEISKEFGAHERNTAVHKTAEEQSKLDHLAEDPDATYATKEDVQEASYLLELDYNDSAELLKEKFAPVVERVLRGHVFDILVKYHYSGALYYMYHVKYVKGQHDSEIEFRGELFVPDGSVDAEVVGMKSFCISVQYDEEYNIVGITPVSRATDSFLLTKDAVRDTLDSDSQDCPLSAGQGKILKGAIDEVAGKIGQIEVNPDVCIATFDCTLSDDDSVSNMLAAFQDFYDRGVLFNKPVYLRYRWKTDYKTENAEVYEFLVQGVYHAEKVNELVFSSPVKVVLSSDPRHPVAYVITLGITAEGMVDTVDWREYPEPEDESMIFLLCENGDGVISATDSDSKNFYPVRSAVWGKLVDAMKSGDKRITIMLKTKDSGIYCPASYQMKWNEEGKGFEGKLSIQYLKEIERVQYWCVADYVFGNPNGYFLGIGSIYDEMEEVDGNWVHLIKRYALNVPEVVRFTVNLKDMDERDSIQSEAIEASLIAQAEKVVDWSKTIELLLWDGNDNGGGSTYTATMISRKYTNGSSVIGVRMVFKTPGDLLDRLAEGLKFNIVLHKDTGKINCSIVDDWLQNPEIFHLRENNDNVISASDNQKGGDWNYFNEELKKGNQPVVYLKTPTSEYECPVRYSFVKNADGTMPGMMEIFYPKNVDGQWQLWIERRHFPDSCSFGNYYEGATSMSEGPEIIKANLSDSISPVVELVSEYPTDLSPYADGTFFIKQQIS